MPIETICKNCARKLRVGDEFAGRKARCPHCKNVYTVPQALDTPSVNPQSPLETGGRPTQPEPSGEQWRLRTEDGNVYGPVSKTDVDSWLTEGRITAACHLQRDGSVQWMPATTVYPVLAKAAARATHANPFADGAAANANPYSAPTSGNPVIRPRQYQPHRGGMLLALGVLGIACCGFLAPIAWVMGHADLKQIREGRMDPSGRGLTQAGMVLGIIGTLLMVLPFVLMLISAIAN
ncbi:MAG TPA: DUF4190 domain-containing protein [Pirellulaceae bacterium]|jgi:hypothetical protein|nr:DUF4190 domain-containing protein [Pirellulaceae bacterium]